MALHKTISNPRGFATSYHKIKDVAVAKERSNFNRFKLNDEGESVIDTTVYYDLSITVNSFVSEEIRQSSEQLIADQQSLTLQCTLDELATTPIMLLCYNKLKETRVFAEATDC